ncbi:hypothetical protein FRX31_020075, partial [Thalictrum thalictroides]
MERGFHPVYTPSHLIKRDGSRVNFLSERMSTQKKDETKLELEVLEQMGFPLRTRWEDKGFLLFRQVHPGLEPAAHRRGKRSSQSEELGGKSNLVIGELGALVDRSFDVARDVRYRAKGERAARALVFLAW